MLTDRHSGVVNRTLSDQSLSPLQVTLNNNTNQLASISSLGTSKDGFTYVLLEIERPGPQINVQREIRKYSRDGRLLGTVSDIPPQLEVSPTTEFLVKGDIIYQMLVAADGVTINKWDMH